MKIREKTNVKSLRKVEDFSIKKLLSKLFTLTLHSQQRHSYLCNLK